MRMIIILYNLIIDDIIKITKSSKRGIPMWTRAELKERAKLVLKQNYWTGVLAYLIYNAIVGVIVFVIYIGMFVALLAVTFSTNNSVPAIITVSSIGFVLIMAILLVTAIPMAVGLTKYFNEASLFKTDFKNLLFAFNDGNFPHILGAMLWNSLFTFLWALLLYIPGIIKSISYCMTAYILTDNPNIGHRRALKLSMQMTKGHKWNIFVLQLSFLGWFLLASLTGGIGYIFLMPYYLATFSELYAKLRLNTLSNGLCTFEELNINVHPKTI
jgi:uncharacterized membrane protein